MSFFSLFLSLKPSYFKTTNYILFLSYLHFAILVSILPSPPTFIFVFTRLKNYLSIKFIIIFLELNSYVFKFFFQLQVTLVAASYILLLPVLKNTPKQKNELAYLHTRGRGRERERVEKSSCPYLSSLSLVSFLN